MRLNSLLESLSPNALGAATVWAAKPEAENAVPAAVGKLMVEMMRAGQNFLARLRI